MKKDNKKTKNTCCDCGCGDLKEKLEIFREKVLNASWHHMQVESGVKQLLVEFIDILKEDK